MPPERRTWLLDRGAVGRLRAPVERLLADPKTLATAARLLLDLHFTPVLAELICAAVDLDVPTLDFAASGGAARTARLRPRRRGFAEEVLRAYAYQCAMCGFDGALGRYPVGIEAAHVPPHRSWPGRHKILTALGSEGEQMSEESRPVALRHGVGQSPRPALQGPERSYDCTPEGEGHLDRMD